MLTIDREMQGRLVNNRSREDLLLGSVMISLKFVALVVHSGSKGG